MKAEILSIGTELLVGSILNSNAQFLCQELAQNGIDVYHQSTVGDNVGRIVEDLTLAATRSDLIITTGGLGPTEDDVTSEAVAKFLNEPLVLHKPTYKYILQRLKKRKLRMTPIVAKQCYIPRGAQVFINDFGTASGYLARLSLRGAAATKQSSSLSEIASPEKLARNDVWVMVLPGPPRELKPMFSKQALSLLQKKSGYQRDHFMIRSIKIVGFLEHQVAEKVGDLLKLKPPVTVGIYAKPGETELKIMSKSPSKSQAQAECGKIEKIIRKRLGNFIYGTDEETLSEAVGNLLRKNKSTLAVAESCTGGLLGHLLTEASGSSDYFLGGLIAYANRVKTSELNVDPKVLEKLGAVSSPVAAQMAEGVRKKFNSTYGIGITGVAGPSGGTAKKPVGLVFVALSAPKKTLVKEFRFLGERGLVKFRSAQEALNLLRLNLLN